jgi:serine/threonine protein kinase
MAPEVLKGEINLANPAMDIWAVGMMMFIMLFGYHPFMPSKFRYSKEGYDLKSLI